MDESQVPRLCLIVESLDSTSEYHGPPIIGVPSQLSLSATQAHIYSYIRVMADTKRRMVNFVSAGAMAFRVYAALPGD